MGSTEVRSYARQKAFLASFSKNGNVSQACREAGVESRTTPYRWAREDEEFAQAWERAEQEAVDRLEEAARIRAEEGTVDYVVSQGRLVYIDDPDNPGQKIPLQKRQYSDQLLIALLKAHRPQKYRERVEHSGNSSEPITFTLNLGQQIGVLPQGPEMEALPEPKNGEDPQAGAQGPPEGES